MALKKNIKLISKKYPKLFRRLSFDIFATFNFFCFFISLPYYLIFSCILKIKILKSKKIKKIIIRNDNLGDCVLSLPFIYGTVDNKEEYYFLSPILKQIIDQLNINCNWKSINSINNNQHLIISNLATAKISSFEQYLPTSNSKIIFTQFNTDIFSKRGYQIIFHPRYNENKSQTKFVSNCFKKLRINSDPILGIKVINSNLQKYVNHKVKNNLVIYLGFGIDKGRKLSQNLLKFIITIARKESLIPIILEEPGHEIKAREIARNLKIETKSCHSFLDLFIFFKSSKYAIGYDCGPMHLASLLTNSIILFSHTPLNFWGKHIWHKLVSIKNLRDNHSKIKVIEQLNIATLKNNWLICQDERGCPLHKIICENNNCSELNTLLIKKALTLIIK